MVDNLLGTQALPGRFLEKRNVVVAGVSGDLQPVIFTALSAHESRSNLEHLFFHEYILVVIVRGIGRKHGLCPLLLVITLADDLIRRWAVAISTIDSIVK